MKTTLPTAEQLALDWANNSRWQGVKRTYSAEDVVRLRGTVHVEHSLARRGAERLWRSLHEESFVNALGALTGNQAMQQVKAGLKAIYLSGWQVAADANTAGSMYPDQSLYPVDSVPNVVRRINNTLLRADEIHHAEGKDEIDWLVPIVADAEAGFGGVLNAYELMKHMIDAGAAGVHFEDQLASAKKCGHMGGKVLVLDAGSGAEAGRRAPGRRHRRRADRDRGAHRCDGRRAADLRHRSQRQAAPDRRPHGGRLLRDPPGHRAGDQPRAGLRALRRPHLVRDLDPGPGAGASSSPTRSTPSSRASSWPTTARRASTGRRTSTTPPSRRFQKEIGAMGYKFQFITLAGFHALNYSMWHLATGYKERQMSAYVELQTQEFAAESRGYTGAKHQREVGTGYFDKLNEVIAAGQSSLSALHGSTEEEQFHAATRSAA